MKAKHLLAITSAFVLILGISLVSYSFTDKDKPAPSKKTDKEMRKIQVIRSYQGLVNTYDTLVPASSNYTEADFLADLGFENDENLSYIKIDDQMLDIDLDFTDFNCVSNGENSFWDGNSFKMKLDFKELEEEIEGMFEEISVQVGSGLEELEQEIEEELKNADFKSKVFIHKDGETEEGDFSDFHELFEMIGKELKNEFHNFDTTITSPGAMIKIDCDFSTDGEEMTEEEKEELHKKMMKFHHSSGDDEGEKEEIHKKIIMMQHSDFESEDGEDIDIDFDFDMDLDLDAHSFFAPGKHCWTFDLNCDESDNEDFTLVITTEGTEEDLRAFDIDEKLEDEAAEFKVYPNPASDFVQITMDFDKKKTTTMQIVDLNGKVVLEENFGKFSGQMTKRIDVGELTPGAYVIQLRHGNQELNEKLLIQ